MFRTIINTQSVVAISDTHGRHRSLQIPRTDILIHAGDACTDGNMDELKVFFDWYAGLPARYKIFVPGNHDLIFELEPDSCGAIIPANVIWLNNAVIKIAGITVGALPPHFHWIDSFAHAGDSLDILITHAPPYGILDRNTGCRELSAYVMNTQPRFHFFRHIHEEAGKIHRIGGSSFVNACVFNE